MKITDRALLLALLLILLMSGVGYIAGYRCCASQMVTAERFERAENAQVGYSRYIERKADEHEGRLLRVEAEIRSLKGKLPYNPKERLGE